MPQGEGGYGLAPAATAWLEERFSRYTAALIDYMRVAQRRGPQSVEGINAWAEAKVRTALAGADFKTFAEDRWNNPGRAVNIRSNDDILGDFNGDVGIEPSVENRNLRVSGLAARLAERATAARGCPSRTVTRTSKTPLPASD